jgi:hypothetical protein
LGYDRAEVIFNEADPGQTCISTWARVVSPPAPSPEVILLHPPATTGEMALTDSQTGSPPLLPWRPPIFSLDRSRFRAPPQQQPFATSKARAAAVLPRGLNRSRS